METNNILNADVLDIIFDGRNKQYGAYQLRKSYNRRLAVAVSAMLCCSLLAVVGKALAKNETGKKITPVVTEIFTLAEVKDKPLTPPPPPQKPQHKFETLKVTPPLIVKDPVPEPPPSEKEIEDANVGSMTIKGDKGDEIAQPIETINTGAPKELIREEKIDVNMPVQILAQFPGGISAWIKYLEHNLRQNIPVNNGAPAGDYQVIVSFIVDKDGTISQVNAENDPGYGIAAEAVRVIQKSGKWVPAVQNGRNVTYRQKQPITFRVSEE